MALSWIDLHAREGVKAHAEGGEEDQQDGGQGDQLGGQGGLRLLHEVPQPPGTRVKGGEVTSGTHQTSPLSTPP